MINKKLGFVDAYMGKTAQGAWARAALPASAEAAKFGGETLASILPYLLLVPVLMGAGAGALHSKVTSPSKLDEASVQKALEVAELEEFMAELSRRKAQASKEEEEDKEKLGAPGERSLHI